MLSILYKLFVMPIQLVVEMTYSIMFRFFGNKGLAIIAVSLVIQTLVLPLYKRSDALQEEERKKQEDMSHWVKHIKKTFKGDEQFMMLSTYYRQQNYKTYYSLKSSFSILLQIPFFLAAYHYLSNLNDLKGTPFLLIKDLGQADQLLNIMGHPVNLLPILMTVINVISGIIYTKGLPLKSKIQVYGLALIFLIVLYKSPSGLVLYWTMNNVYSLLKNIFSKILKHPLEVLGTVIILAGVTGIGVFAYIKCLSGARLVFLSAFICLGIILLFAKSVKKKNESRAYEFNQRIGNIDIDGKLFAWEVVFFTILIGVLIPLAVIRSSATEFIVDGRYPTYLVLNDFLIYVGVFIVWFSIFYYLMPKNIRKIFSISMFALVGCVLINYLAFGTKLGTMSSQLVFEHPLGFSVKEKLINIVVLLLACVFLVKLCIKKSGLCKHMVQIVIVCMAILCVIDLRSVHQQLVTYEETKAKSIYAQDGMIPLSKDGKNVVVIMLDRAIDGYVPYMFDEKPELREMYAGFTYYPNTISYGAFTNFGTPGLFGGYEYTPVEMNARADESLKDKQNEALSVMPVLFSDNGYHVTVCDPPYANYQWDPDISIYDQYEGIHAYITQGTYKEKVSEYVHISNTSIQETNFIYYGLMKVMPVALQNKIYCDGRYLSLGNVNSSDNGIYPVFLDWYAPLLGLEDMTRIVNDDTNTFLMLQNSVTHEPQVLTTPEYVPSENIDINAELENQPDLENNGNVLKFETESQLAHYRTNMAAMLEIGKWLDYLKENDVYDNTRIIIVSDHGKDMDQIDSWKFDNGIDVFLYSALLMIKDFDEDEFKQSDEFMTNADVPTYAVEGLIENPVNPFTGKRINNNEKYAHPQRITTSKNYEVDKYNGNTFDTGDGQWYDVKDNIFDENNWELVE
ncbi:MAG: membrane protein insertase YidC [Lachnospiraceae bacterium]